MDPISPELVLVDPRLASAADPFRVAFVCTGNRFRSALGEAAFRAATAGLPLEVSSFGILDLGAARPLPQAIQAAQAFGLEISTHVARPLTGADLSAMALVVGFEAHHTDAAVRLAGAHTDRAFLLLELADLLADVQAGRGTDPVERAVDVLARANRDRRAEPGRWGRREIPDPVQLADADQAVVGRVVCEAATRLAEHLFKPNR